MFSNLRSTVPEKWHKDFKDCCESWKKKIDHLVHNFSCDELSSATSSSLYISGQRNAAKILRKIVESPTEAEVVESKLYSEEAMEARNNDIRHIEINKIKIKVKYKGIPY